MKFWFLCSWILPLPTDDFCFLLGESRAAWIWRQAASIADRSVSSRVKRTAVGGSAFLARAFFLPLLFGRSIFLATGDSARLPFPRENFSFAVSSRHRQLKPALPRFLSPSAVLPLVFPARGFRRPRLRFPSWCFPSLGAVFLCSS
jgi:hypothetical protein